MTDKKQTPKSAKRKSEVLVTPQTPTEMRCHAANKEINDSIYRGLVPQAEAQGSKGIPWIFRHHADATCKAVFPDMKKSDTEEIATRPWKDRIKLALLRHRLAALLPVWEETDRLAGVPKSYKLKRRAEAWCAVEVKAMDALTDEALYQRFEAEVPMLEAPTVEDTDNG